MKFELMTSKYLYSKEQAEKLRKLGFNFRGIKFSPDIFEVIDKNFPKIEIDTLEDLMGLIKSYGSLVISGEKIIIYDRDIEYSCLDEA